MADRHVLIALGGAGCVWGDLSAAQAIVGPHDIGAVNEAGRDYAGDLTLWCSLHPEKMEDWQRGRKGNQDYACVSHKLRHGARIDRAVPEKWSGSSGLYLAQVALSYGYDRIVCCGMPMNAAPHFFGSKPWKDAARFRDGWRKAKTELAGKVRSMSGFTRDLLGAPDEEWLSGQ